MRKSARPTWNQSNGICGCTCKPTILEGCAALTSGRWWSAYAARQSPQDQRNANNPHERKVRMAIAEMRKDGEPVCSDSGGGYWWAESLEEVEAVTAELEGRAKDLLETASVMRKRALEAFGAQARLF